MACGAAAFVGELQHVNPFAAVQVEDVLMTPSGQRCLAGITFYRSVLMAYNVVLIGLEDHTDWLYRAGISGFDNFVQVEGHRLALRSDIVQTVTNLRLVHKYPIEMVVVTDPTVASLLFEAGYVVSLFMHPTYARPEWRPDTRKQITPWEDLAAAMSAEMLRAAADDRAKTED